MEEVLTFFLLSSFYSGVDFNLSLKVMLLSPACFGKPYWKYLNGIDIVHTAVRTVKYKLCSMNY